MRHRPSSAVATERPAIQRRRVRHTGEGLLLCGAKVLDVAALEFRQADVLIRNDTIEAIGDLSLPGAVHTVDVRGLYMIPGLIDAHIHLCMTGMHQRFSEMPDALATAMVNAKRLLEDGVTTIRSAGERGDAALPPDVQIMAKAPLWQFLTPQLISCGGRTLFSEELNLEDLAAVRRAVEDRKARGAAWIKLMLGPEDRLGRIGPIIGGIRRMGLRSFCHGQTPETGRVVRAGVDSVEHTYYLDRRSLGCFRPSQFLVPTLAVSEGGGVEVTRLAMQMGVSIGVGSDAGTPGFPVAGSLLREMSLLVEKVGVPPLKAVQLATIHNARLLRLRKVGQITRGHRADVVLLRQDPTHDIGRLAHVAMVVVRGKVAVDRELRCADTLRQRSGW